MLLIANPASRRGARRYQIALDAFRAAGVQCDPVRTERAGHAAELASDAAGRYAAVFALGGDGTAMEVMGALARSGMPVGILPGGTGNLVARALGVPLRVERAVLELLAGVEATIDLGLTGTGRHFAFTAGVGIDARMIHETPAGLKRRVGIAAYALTAARASLSRHTFIARVEVDDYVIEREAVAVMIANFGTVLNDLLVLGPGILCDDGLLDCCIFSPAGALASVGLAWRLLRKDFSAHPAMLYRPGREFRITCTPPQLFQADGEVLGTTPFTARVEALAGRVLLPAKRR